MDIENILNVGFEIHTGISESGCNKGSRCNSRINKGLDVLHLGETEGVTGVANKVISNVIDLIPFLEKCCHGLNASPEEVKQKLLNAGNIEDIISGDIPAKTVQTHIKLWVIEGKQNYSGNEK